MDLGFPNDPVVIVRRLRDRIQSEGVESLTDADKSDVILLLSGWANAYDLMHEHKSMFGVVPKKDLKQSLECNGLLGR